MRAAPIGCPEESPLPVTVYANFAVKARDKGCGFHGYLASFGASAGAYLLPRGADAPTTARTVGLPPRGGQYFLSKRKKVPKKASGTATPGKRLLLPILTAGLAMSRAMELDSLHTGAERARARLFPPTKWAGLFPSAAYRRPAPAQLALGRLKWRCLGCFGEAWMITQRGKKASFFLRSWRFIYSAHASWNVSTWTGYFCNTKGQRGFTSTLAFTASRRACRPTAVFPIQPSRSHIRPASREARCRAAVKPRPSPMSPYAPARIARSPGSRGTAPC